MIADAVLPEVEAAAAADGGEQEELPSLLQLEGEHAVPHSGQALSQAVAKADAGQHGDQGLRAHRRRRRRQRASLPSPFGQVFLQSPPAVRNPPSLDGFDVGTAYGQGEAAAGTEFITHDRNLQESVFVRLNNTYPQIVLSLN